MTWGDLLAALRALDGNLDYYLEAEIFTADGKKVVDLEFIGYEAINLITE